MTNQFQANQAQSIVPLFAGLGIFPPLLTIIEQLRFTVPTPIQHQSIPAGIEGKDIIGIAQTGTGKTLAFGIPMVQRLYSTKGRGLILVPTRELALQVDETFRKIGRPLGLQTAVLIGGESIRPQLDALRRAPRIIIATPGRLIDHLQRGNVRLSDVKILVLDEADRMLDMGFAPQINQILKTVPKDRQTLLYSATMPQTIARMAANYMALPVRVEIAPSGTTLEQVEQEIVIVRKESKHDLLETILHGCDGTVLVFARTKHGAKKICRDLQRTGHAAAEIHSNRSLAQRRQAMDGFRSGKFRTLVATDIAARGIDVRDIALVINYDLPDDTENYVHRIGRTGRAGRKGRAISFATPDQRGTIRDIERLIRKALKVVPLPPLPPPKVSAPAPASPRPRAFHPRSPQRKFGARRWG